jgi:hypothetical protein
MEHVQPVAVGLRLQLDLDVDKARCLAVDSEHFRLAKLNIRHLVSLHLFSAWLESPEVFWFALVGSLAAQSPPSSHHWDKWTAIATVALAGGTALLAIASVLPLNRWLFKAHLRIEIAKQPPDTHQILSYVQPTRPDEALVSFQTIYVRARITHERGPSAENVELLAKKVWDDKGGSFKERASFLPLNLVWSHVGQPTSRIPGGVFRHCDLGRLQQHPTSGDTIFVLSTLVQPNPVALGALPSVLPAGSYVIQLSLTGDNVRHRLTSWHLSFPPEWSDDEATMLGRITLELQLGI